VFYESVPLDKYKSNKMAHAGNEGLRDGGLSPLITDVPHVEKEVKSAKKIMVQ